MRRSLGVAVALAVTSYVILASAIAGAVPVADAPSAAAGDTPAPPGWVPIEGLDTLQVPATPVGIPDLVEFHVCLVGPCPDPIDGPRPIDCEGCSSDKILNWRDHWGWEEVWTSHVHNHAAETIDAQDLHYALISSSTNQCYDGSTRASGSWSTTSNTVVNSAVLSSGIYTAVNDRWTLAGGHNWYDDGDHWAVGAEGDMCKQF
jgi:hypothetical protein